MIKHNLLYEIKYNLNKRVDYKYLNDIINKSCDYIERRYSIKFKKGIIKDSSIYFIVKSKPSYSISKIVNIIKGIISKFYNYESINKLKWVSGYTADTRG